MTDLRVGYPYIVVVERELVPRTVLGWGVCLRGRNFSVWKTEKDNDFRMEVSHDVPPDAAIARTPEDLPVDPRVRNMLLAALMVDMFKTTLDLWAGTAPSAPPSRAGHVTTDFVL